MCSFSFNFLDNKILMSAYEFISVHVLCVAFSCCCYCLFVFCFKNGFAEFFRLCHLETGENLNVYLLELLLLSVLQQIAVIDITIAVINCRSVTSTKCFAIVKLISHKEQNSM